MTTCALAAYCTKGLLNMNYLVCMLLIALAMLFFLRVLTKFERGLWPSDNARSMSDAVRELIVGSRVS